MKIINLDHISSNPILPEVKEAMKEAIDTYYANPSSQHKLGDVAAEALEKSRESVAKLVHADIAREVVFTSCGTESVNHAIKGVAYALEEKGIKKIDRVCDALSNKILSSKPVKLRWNIRV